VGSVGGEPGKSLKVCLRGARAGLWIDRATGEKGNAISLVAAVKGFDKAEAQKWANRWLKTIESQPKSNRSAPASRKAAAAPKKVIALRIWSKAKAVSRGSPVGRYLRSRGIECPIPNCIRQCKSLAHRSGTSFPALVAAVRDVHGKIIGIHRIFLAPGGTAKALVKDPKMALGPISGGTVRLAEAESKVAICEGIETGMSVMAACPDLPVWVALSSSGMKAVQLPENITEVLLLADGDEPGKKAARETAKRLTREGKTVRIARPPEGKDFNDLLNR